MIQERGYFSPLGTKSTQNTENQMDLLGVSPFSKLLEKTFLCKLKDGQIRTVFHLFTCSKVRPCKIK